MSYAFGMFFKQIKQEDLLSFIDKVQTEMRNHAEEWIDYNKCYVPSVRSLTNAPKFVKTFMNEYWLNTLFTSRFVYWPDYDLLGVSGYKLPGEIENLFDGHFSFQNSSDQDYDYDQWPTGIRQFKARIDMIKNADDSTLYECVDKYMGDYSIEEIKADPEYFKKVCIYDMIYEDLQLNDWLYNHDNPAFYQLSINAINDDGQRIRYNAMLWNILKKEFEAEEAMDFDENEREEER